MAELPVESQNGRVRLRHSFSNQQPTNYTREIQPWSLLSKHTYGKQDMSVRTTEYAWKISKEHTTRTQTPDAQRYYDDSVWTPPVVRIPQ